MPKKVYVDVSVRLVILVADGVDVGDIVNDLDYEFFGEGVESAEISGFEVTDSK